MVASLAQRLQSPWRDRRGNFSPLKAICFALILTVPVYSMMAPVLDDGVGPKPAIFLIYQSGVWATALLLISLAITPARHVLGWSQLIVVRRMIGVSALVYTIVHFIIFFWLNDFEGTKIGLEFQRLTVWIASLSTIAMVALGVTSLDAAIAKMGAKAWNRLHSLTYILTALAIFHFLLSRASIAGTPFMMTGMFFYLMGWRVLHRLGKGTDPLALIVLAVLAAALSLGIEMEWLNFYRRRRFAETWGAAISFRYDLAPTWQILIIGLIVAALPPALRRQKLIAKHLATGSMPAEQGAD